MRLSFVTTILFHVLHFLAAALAQEGLEPYKYGFDVTHVLRRQTAQQIVVSRLPSINGSIPVRLEIKQIKSNARKWNLYLLALSMMQNTGQDQELSWYQITGIHGVPFVSWNGVQPAHGGHGGYCTHMSILFPTWHRPYLALYEQIIFHLVQRIASWFPDPVERALYQTAAADFRLPYWDWALTPAEGENIFLDDFVQRGVRVYGPNGEQLIANPLFSYRFRPLDPGVFEWGDFPSWTETKRAPTGNVSHNERVRLAINRVQPNLRDRLFNLFTNYPEFGPFSNKHWSDDTAFSRYDSLESLHDEIHIEVGDGGHLYFIQYSAFDPIFFLHHTMVDRILALWQVLHPESWVPVQVVTTPSFTISNGTEVNSTTPLAPFYSNSNGDFWTSETARYTEAFGYSYAEVRDMNGEADAEKSRRNRARLSATINRLYGALSMSTMLRNRKRAIEEGHRWPWLWGLFTRRTLRKEVGVLDVPRTSTSRPDELLSSTEPSHYTEWLANVRVENGALNGSFSVCFFLGQPPSDFTMWKLADNLVGTMGVFSMSHMAYRNRVSGTVPITSSLARAITPTVLIDLNVVETQEYLRHNLQFRVSDMNGEIEPSLVRGLCVDIASSDVTATSHEEELPRWGPVKKRFIMFC